MRDFSPDTAGGEWYIIIGTDSNGYTTGRAYVADDALPRTVTTPVRFPKQSWGATGNP